MTLAIPWNDNKIGKILQLLFAAVSFVPKTDSGAGEDANETAALIMDRYGDSILRYAYSYLHNMSDAEEILQDTLLTYLVNKPAFANEAHAKAWLFRVAGNLSKNRIRYNGYRNHDELMEELVAEEKEDLRFVWEAVSQLPENYREVIHLFYPGRIYDGADRCHSRPQRGDGPVRSFQGAKKAERNPEGGV